MTPRISISESELIAALASSVDSVPEDAKTPHEIADANGWAHSQVMKALRKLHAQGRLQHHRVPREGIDGRRIQVAAYTIKAAS